MAKVEKVVQTEVKITLDETEAGHLLWVLGQLTAGWDGRGPSLYNRLRGEGVVGIKPPYDPFRSL